jgi:hypothetical protein
MPVKTSETPEEIRRRSGMDPDVLYEIHVLNAIA